MFASHLECPRCARTYSCEQVTQLCECGSPLLVRYDLARAAASVSKEKIYSRGSDLWRYREFLPVREERHIVSLGEGMTPMLRLNRTGQATGMARLYMKDEGIIPTGTFKARGAAVGVSKALELGVKALAMPTNGNAGGAWAAYCAAAGIRAVIAMPEDAPRITRSECVVTGASLWLVKGLISDAGKIIGRAVKRYGLYDASTLKEPYRIEGKKTMGLEIAEQFGWEVPDVILYPTGGGVGLIGIYKALLELREIGWIGEKMPRLVAVQAEGCAPIVRAWQEKKTDSVFFEKSKTIAFGINVPKALGDFLVLDAVYRTGGAAVAVSDEEILNALSLLGRMEGAFVCPEGAATLAAAKKLRDEGWISPEERVVLLNTGTGIKYPETVHVEAPLLAPDDEIEL
ncbi:MAG: threonine synthase [Spirochaetes bacterium]|nr:threonine synthase [Spirochaetota bacterium]